MCICNCTPIVLAAQNTMIKCFGVVSPFLVIIAVMGVNSRPSEQNSSLRAPMLRVSDAALSLKN